MCITQGKVWNPHEATGAEQSGCLTALGIEERWNICYPSFVLDHKKASRTSQPLDRHAASTHRVWQKLQATYLAGVSLTRHISSTMSQTSSINIFKGAAITKENAMCTEVSRLVLGLYTSTLTAKLTQYRYPSPSTVVPIWSPDVTIWIKDYTDNAEKKKMKDQKEWNCRQVLHISQIQHPED